LPSATWSSVRVRATTWDVADCVVCALRTSNTRGAASVQPGLAQVARLLRSSRWIMPFGSRW
jgi:hypothetical protein